MRARARLGWRLVRSHLQATLLAQLITLGAIGLLLVFAGAAPAAPPGAEAGLIGSRTAVAGVLLLLVGALSGVAAASIAARLARSYGRRLEQLAAATAAAAAGDRSARVATGEPDEIGQIGAHLNRLNERLDAAERGRRDFLANVSHELRTPLTIIQGHLEAQLRTEPSAPACRETLELIDREARVLATLIEDLFTLTRAEEAQLTLQRRPVAVPALAAAAVAGVGPLARRHGQILVHSVVPANLPPAWADPERLAQILNNLLHNALRATPEGGVIVVEGQLTADGSAIELAVSDTGLGIEADELPQIFERRFQGPGRTAGGSGLGLAIVRELVEAHGGRVRATSVVGQGTTIRFTLPRAR